MECGVVGEHLQDSVFSSLTLAPTIPEWLFQEQRESAGGVRIFSRWANSAFFQEFF